MKLMLDYLTLKPEVFGLDISDLSLKMVKLKKKGRLWRASPSAGDYLSLASFGEMEIKPGIIEKGEIRDQDLLAETIKKALTKVRGEGLKTKYVIASLPEEKAFLQVIQMPPMREEEMKKAVYFEAENYIPLPVDKVYLDAQIVHPAYNHLDHLDVLIAALPQKTVDSYFSSLKKSGLKPLVLEIESQAVSRALIKNAKSTEPLLLMDLGATRTSLIIFSGCSPRFTSSLPISSRGFTEAIAKGLNIDFKKAEELKIKKGIEGQAGKEIFKALEPHLKDLANQIKKYLNYYQTHSAHEHLPPAQRGVAFSEPRQGREARPFGGRPDGKGVERIILCGGGANLKGLCNFLSRELKLSVELGNPWVNILPQPLKEVPELSYQESLRYTTALGLAQRNNI